MRSLSYSHLVSFVDSLIDDKAVFADGTCHLPLSKLEDDELIEFAYLTYENFERDTCDLYCEPMVENAYIAMMQDASAANKEAFAERVIQSSIKTFKQEMRNMLDDRCENFDTTSDVDNYSDEPFLTMRS